MIRTLAQVGTELQERFLATWERQVLKSEFNISKNKSAISYISEFVDQDSNLLHLQDPRIEFPKVSFRKHYSLVNKGFMFIQV